MGFAEAVMIHDSEQNFDEDFYVIDEPPALVEVAAREPLEHRVVREQLLEVAPSSPLFQIYWTLPMDIDWDD